MISSEGKEEMSAHRFVDRRLSFGSVAERYDALRPAYPEAAVDAVLDYA